MTTGRAEDRLRLAFIGNSANILVQRWTGWFARRGHEVTVLDGFANGANALVRDGVNILPYDARGRWRLPLASALHARRTVRRLLSQLNPDVVHAHTVRPYGWQAGLAGFHPYVISTLGSDVLLPLPGFRARFWQHRTLSRADLVTAVSPFMRDAAIRHGARAEHVVQVQFGVDTQRFSPTDHPARELAHLGLDRRPFVFSPRALKPIYNHQTILAAFAEAGAGHRLVMTGRNADLSHVADLTATMDRLGIQDRVTIIDDAADDEMLALFQSARAVVSAPLSDSFPLTLLEAMACGTPVVAGDLPPVRAVLELIAPAAIVPTGDPTAMARVLRETLAMDPAARADLGRELRRLVVETADYETNMLRMEDLYRGLAARDG